MGFAVSPMAYAQQDEDPKAAADRAVKEATAKAQAEKARNDKIVEQQRAAQKAEKGTPAASPGKPAGGGAGGGKADKPGGGKPHDN
jgi:hypothetical protein